MAVVVVEPLVALAERAVVETVFLRVARQERLTLAVVVALLEIMALFLQRAWSGRSCARNGDVHQFFGHPDLQEC